MSYELDCLYLSADELDVQTELWTKILGFGPASGAVPRFHLGNISLVLERDVSSQGKARGPRLCALGFANHQETEQASHRGLDIRLSSENHGAGPPRASDAVIGVDHVVLRTRDSDAAESLFAHRLGLRLALRQHKPEWGGEMLFFRTRQMSIEVIANDKNPSLDDLWGVALACDDIHSCHGRLRGIGLDISDVRDGRKPGTKVATVKDAPVPVLLIEHVRPARVASDP